jgi:hypothetical protein
VDPRPPARLVGRQVAALDGAVQRPWRQPHVRGGFLDGEHDGLPREPHRWLRRRRLARHLDHNGETTRPLIDQVQQCATAGDADMTAVLGPRIRRPGPTRIHTAANGDVGQAPAVEDQERRCRQIVGLGGRPGACLKIVVSPVRVRVSPFRSLPAKSQRRVRGYRRSGSPSGQAYATAPRPLHPSRRDERQCSRRPQSQTHLTDTTVARTG